MADTKTPSKEAMEAARWLRRASEGDIARALDAFAAPYKAEVATLTDENSDLRYEPWPEWATAVLNVIRERTGYDGYDDAEGVDLPGELDECMAELEREADRKTQEARAKFLTDQAEKTAEHYKAQSDALTAQVAALREALEKISGMGTFTGPVSPAYVNRAVNVASTALTNTQATADLFRRETEARGMEMAAKEADELGKELGHEDAGRKAACFGARVVAKEIRQAAGRHRAGTSEGEVCHEG